jgi:hypothetical protein
MQMRAYTVLGYFWSTTVFHIYVFSHLYMYNDYIYNENNQTVYLTQTCVLFYSRINNDVHLIIRQHAQLEFYSASPLK